MNLQIKIHPRFHLKPLVVILLTLMGLAFIIAMVRYSNGIGAISNLSYSYPWGFWISFDLFTGVAISSGAFLMAAVVYIFELKEFRPLIRPSVLTGFLGYTMVVIALLVDLGHPERIWYMLIHWNHTSVLLEIGICVMSYLTVLAIEFAPVVFEGLKMAEIRPLYPPLYYAIRDFGRCAFHFAPILAGFVVADPAGQAIPVVVDAHFTDFIFYLGGFDRSFHDHFRVISQRSLFPPRPRNSSPGKISQSYPGGSGDLPYD